MPRKRKYVLADGYVPSYITPELLLYKVYNYETDELVGEFETEEEAKDCIRSMPFRQIDEFMEEQIPVSLVIPYGKIVVSQSAFQGLGNLKEVSLPASLLEIQDSAFDGCDLRSLSLPEGVYKIGDRAFCNAHLTSLTLPIGLQIIGSMAFSGAIHPEERDGKQFYPTLDIPNSVISIGENAFSGAYVKTVNIDSHLGEIANFPWGISTTFTEYKAPVQWNFLRTTGWEVHDNADYSLLGVYDTASEAATAILSSSTECSIVIPYGTTTISMGAFSRATALKTVYMPDTLTTINSGAFSTSGITKIHVPNSVVNLSGAYIFNYCTSLEEVYIGSSIISGDLIFDQSFNIKKVYLEATQIPNQSGFLAGRQSLTTIIMPNLMSVPENFAAGNIALTTVKAPNLIEIGTKAFYQSGISSIRGSKLITTIGDSAFKGTHLWDKIELPVVETIGDSAFADMTKTESYYTDPYFELGSDNIQSIGTNAFSNSGITSITFLNMPENSVSGSPWGATNATVVWSDT